MARRTVLVLLFLLASASAETIEIRVPPGLVELEMEFDPGDGSAKPPDVSWQSAYPILLDYKSRTARLDGWTVFIFHASKGAKYAIDGDVIDWAAQERTRKRFIVRVEGKPPPKPDPDPQPDPDPGPTPDLVGFAKDVFEQAVKVRKEGASRIADAFRGVLKDIGSISPLVAASRLAERIKAIGLDMAWQPFLTWLGSELDQRTQTRQQIQKVYPEVIQGLEAADDR